MSRVGFTSPCPWVVGPVQGDTRHSSLTSSDLGSRANSDTDMRVRASRSSDLGCWGAAVPASEGFILSEVMGSVHMRSIFLSRRQRRRLRRRPIFVVNLVVVYKTRNTNTRPLVLTRTSDVRLTRLTYSGADEDGTRSLIECHLRPASLTQRSVRSFVRLIRPVRRTSVTSMLRRRRCLVDVRCWCCSA